MYQDSVHEGYLTKSPPKMNRRWQRRYFVLLPSKKLLYFSRLNGDLKGTIDLSRLQEILFDLYLDKGPSNVMSLEVRGAPELNPKSRGTQDRVYYLLSDSREEMVEWHGHIMNVAELQLCPKKNVVVDATQGDEYYISARRITVIKKEEKERRGLVQSLSPDTNLTAEYGTYQTNTDLAQSVMVPSSYGLYDVNHAQNLSDITISQGEDSSSEEETSSPVHTKRPKSPTPKKVTSVNSLDTSIAYTTVQRAYHTSIEEDTQPAIPPHKEDKHPQSLDLHPPLPPERDSSRSRHFIPVSLEEHKSVTRDRKAKTTRDISKSMIQESKGGVGGSQKRPAAKLPSIPLNVLLTTVKEIPNPLPVPKPRRPTSSSTSSLPTDSHFDTTITPYKTVKRDSNNPPDDEPPLSPVPSYVNVDTSHGIYVKFDPAPSDQPEGNYVSIVRDPIPLDQLIASTDSSGYTKIVEPRPRGKQPPSETNPISCEESK